jgi:PAS domain S-box-containing protein
MYSSTGFDMLGVLARVATRPNPKIVLGPVDMTCSFLVVDVRKWDCPIVYASPTFTRLTGYTEAEIIGRNCRFLQAPPDCPVEKGSERTYTAPDQVQHLYKYLSQDKECQASLINYRKTGEAFINLVTVIPIAWDSDQIAYHVGFQVDLTEQPHAILQTMRDGSYIVNYSSTVPMTPSVSTKNQSRFVSREMKSIIASAFGGSTAYGSSGEDQERLDLNMALLEHSPDVVHVLSLKGSFLFVSPSVKRVLEYDQTDLLGKSISDICHPSDVVPLMRELKDSSPTNPSAATTTSSSTNPAGTSTALTPSSPPTNAAGIPNPSSPILKTVNLLFRVRRKHSGYVWVECIGRLYSEPGKGRKAIILTARRRDMPRLAWSSVEAAGGVGGANVEFWGQVSREGIVLVVSANVKDVVGRGPKEVVGQKIFSFISPSPSATSPSLTPVDGQQQQSSSKIEEVRTVLEEAVCAKPGDERARIAYCDAVFVLPADGGSGANNGATNGMVAVEIAFFPPSSTEGGVSSGNSATTPSGGSMGNNNNDNSGGGGGGNGSQGGAANGSQSIQMIVPEPVPRRPPRPSPPLSGSGAGPPLGSSVPARAAPPPASSAIFRVRLLKSQQEVAAVNNGAAAAAAAARRRYSTSEGVVPKPNVAPTGVGSAAAAGGSFLQRSNSSRSPPGFGGPRPPLTVGTGNPSTSPTMSSYGMTSPTVSAFSPTSATFPSTSAAFASPSSTVYPTTATNTPPSTAVQGGAGPTFQGPTTSNFGGVSNPTGNVFEELEITRGTSWMYELQQLKISNKRMRDEVEVLEKQQQAMQIQAAQAQAQAQAQAVQVAQAQAHMQAQAQAQVAQMQQHQAQEKANNNNGTSSGPGSANSSRNASYNSPPLQAHNSSSSLGSMHSSSSASSGLPMQGIQHSNSSLSSMSSLGHSNSSLPMQGMQQQQQQHSSSGSLSMGSHSTSSLAMHPLQHSNSSLPAMMGMHHTNSSGSIQLQMQQQHSQMQQQQQQAHAQHGQHPIPPPLIHRGSSSGSNVSANGQMPGVMSATASGNMMGMMGGAGGAPQPLRYNTGAPEPASKGKKKRTRDSIDESMI